MSIVSSDPLATVGLRIVGEAAAVNEVNSLASIVSFAVSKIDTPSSLMSKVGMPEDDAVTSPARTASIVQAGMAGSDTFAVPVVIVAV